VTEKQYLISRKLNVLDFADQMKNISEACRRLGVSRQHYYDIKSTLAEEGVEGLMEKTRKFGIFLSL
jgi:ACT domain-containing protein